MDRDLKVRILQIYGDHPVVPANSAQNRLRCLHPKRGPIHTQVQGGQVDDRPPTPVALVITSMWLKMPGVGGAGSTAPLRRRSLISLSKALPLTDWGEYESRMMGIGDRGRGMRKGIAYPSLKTSTTQGSAPLSLQAHHRRDRQPPMTTGHGPWLHLWPHPRLEAGEEPRRGDFLLR